MNIQEFKFVEPDFTKKELKDAPDITTAQVKKDGIAPDMFYLTSHAPTYYKIAGKWKIPKLSSLNCVAVIHGDEIIVTEIKDLKKGDHVVLGHSDNGSLGILKYIDGFPEWIMKKHTAAVESSTTQAYKLLFDLLEDAKNNNGYIVWVLGPAVVFDHDTRLGLSRLAEAGYVHSLLGGNAMATHDLEGGYLSTALGQDIYSQESKPLGHYNHLDLLNEVRRAGSIEEFIKQGNVKNGFIKTLYDLGIPINLAGSIRDDGPLPEVESNMEHAVSAAKKETDKATLIISLATMLHSISTANLASTYRIDDNGEIRPIFVYTIDVTESAVNKIAAAREGIAVKRIITNVQDFVVNLERTLIKREDLD